LHVDRILESSSRPPSSRAFLVGTVKSTRVVARPTSLCHQQPTPLGVKALVLRAKYLSFSAESCTFETYRAASKDVVLISKIYPECALANASIRVLTSLASL
jgi:hypothetical protein